MADADQPYDAHEAKLAILHGRRVKEFDPAVAECVSSMQEVLDLLTGEMKLPGELEGELWGAVIQAVISEAGAGIRINDDPWTLLDLVLALASATEEYPRLLLADVMMATRNIVVTIRGRPVHAGELLEAEYETWSKIPDLKRRAVYHFHFGFLLFTMGDSARGTTELLAARKTDAQSGASDLLMKVLQDSEGKPLVSSDGQTVTLVNGKLHVDGGAESPGSSADRQASPTRQPSTNYFVVGAIACLALAGITAFTLRRLRRGS